MDEALLTMHCIVKGRVQGVFFRQSTLEQARVLALNGWVRNLADGSVELVASGRPSDIDQLKSWLKHGPKRAIVAEIEYLPCLEYTGSGFEIR
ncbi:MAG: acylphosphatase [Gammaproteobacteria bacterium]|nr:acylphosphatase [Gammaproteobacteria bacterium]MDH5693167.1 acylphosphatase [Gammaproteobacteria bacterium]